MAIRLKNKKLSGHIAEQERQRLLALINSMTQAIIAVDQHGHIIIYNSAALNIFDINTINTGESIVNLLKPIDKNNQPVDVLKLIDGSKVPTITRELRLKYNDGSIINLFLSISPVHIGYGKKGNRESVLMIRDITNEKSLEDERNEFVSVVSHELRTPIAIAEGNISNVQYMLDKTIEIDNIKKAINEAHKQVLFLADMINDLSTLSRAENHKLELDIEPIKIDEFMKELYVSYLLDMNNKNLNFVIKKEDNLILSTSRLYIKEILQNFITNAIKYTVKGSVTVVAKSSKKGIEFSVIDTGIGISKHDQQKIFDKFFRSEDYRTRSTSGTGLGLYIALKIARLINADLTFHSELNQGSIFTIYVPNLA